MENNDEFVLDVLRTWAKILDWFHTFCQNSSFIFDVKRPIVTDLMAHPKILNDILNKIGNGQGFFTNHDMSTNWRFKQSFSLQNPLGDHEICIDFLIRKNDAHNKTRHPAYIVLGGILGIEGIETYDKANWTEQDIPLWFFDDNFDEFDQLLHTTWNGHHAKEGEGDLQNLWRLSQPKNGKPQIWWPVGHLNKAVKQFMQLWAAVLHTSPPEWAMDVLLPYTFPVQIQALDTWANLLFLMKEWFKKSGDNEFACEIWKPCGSMQKFELPTNLQENDIVFDPDWKFKQVIRLVNKHTQTDEEERLQFSFWMKNTTTAIIPFPACITITEVQLTFFPKCLEISDMWMPADIPSDFADFQYKLKTNLTVPQPYYIGVQENDYSKLENLWRLVQPDETHKPTAFWPVGGDNLAVQQFIGLLAKVFPPQTVPRSLETTAAFFKKIYTLHARLLLLENKQLKF